MSDRTDREILVENILQRQMSGEEIELFLEETAKDFQPGPNDGFLEVENLRKEFKEATVPLDLCLSFYLSGGIGTVKRENGSPILPIG